MLPNEYNYYSDRLLSQERMEYIQLVHMHALKKISDTAFNYSHDEFWKKVKERVDKKEGYKNE